MKRWAWALCCVSMMVWASSPEPAVPEYPGTSVIRIGNDLAIAGQFYRLGYFSTTDSPQKVKQYFADEWRKRGIPVVADGDWVDEGVVSAFYTRQGLQRSIIVRREESRTLVLIALKDLWASAPAAKAQGFVSIDGTLLQQDLVTRNDADSAQHRTSLVRGDLSSVRTVVRKALETGGFTLLSESAVGDGVSRKFVLVHVQREQRVTSTLSRAGEGVTAVLQTASVSRVGAR